MKSNLNTVFITEDIQDILNSVALGLNEFKTKFPICYEIAEQRKELDEFIKETQKVIHEYGYKISLFGEELIKSELEKYLINARSIIDEGLKNLREWGENAAYVCLYTGHIELFWISKFLEILKSKPNTYNLEKSESFQLFDRKSKITKNTSPHVNPEKNVKIFDLLKVYFEANDHQCLETLINNLGNIDRKLLFKSNGNRLSDFFKRLFEDEVIIGWQKKEMINWIVSNFQYTYRGEVRDFKYKTVEKTIATNEAPCKNPIIIR